MNSKIKKTVALLACVLMLLTAFSSAFAEPTPGEGGIPVEDEPPMGTTFIASADGMRTTQAEAGETITVNTAPATSDFYEFIFDHWEATGLTIPEGDKENTSFSFTMPENAVSLTAIYKKQGVPVTHQLSMSDAIDAKAIAIYWAGTKPLSGVDSTGMAVMETLKAGTRCTFTLVNNNPAYKYDGWTVLESGTDITNDPAKVTITTSSYLSAEFTTEAGKEYTVTANLKNKAFGRVTAAVNDSAMGSATVQTTGTASGSLEGVFEGDTVTVTATPLTGYLFKQWSAAYDNGDPVGADFALANATVLTTTFTMPATSKNITVTAEFEKDPSFMSDECEITDAALYAAGGGTTPLGMVDQVGNAFTIILPHDTDTSGLGQMILKLEHSLGATVKKGKMGR